MPNLNSDLLTMLSNYPKANAYFQNIAKNQSVNNQYIFRIESLDLDINTNILTLVVGPLDTLVRTITAFVDAGGGSTTVTSAGHGFVNGDVVTISGTTNYNGNFAVTVVDEDTFTIVDAFVANDAPGSIVYPDTTYTLPAE